MDRDRFPPGVSERIGWYVYRLIDPRNGETFYVGKGRGDRVFHHVRSSIGASDEEDAADLKLQRIKEITSAGLEVAHVIHRHNIESPDVAYEIEAALIDAYPGVTNKIGGHGGDYGCRHVEEIISEYEVEPFIAMEPLILISIAKSFEDERLDIYQAVRGIWRIDVNKARTFRLVLAHRRGRVLGAFRPTEWIAATPANFPLMIDSDVPGRWGFEGVAAEPSIAGVYLNKRVPDAYRAKGAANPIRFIWPDQGT